MPPLSRLAGMTIAMFYDDHEPAHVHARHATGSAKVAIDTLDVMATDIGPPHLALLLVWTALHHDALIAEWRRARSGEPLRAIGPGA
jgi:phosphomannomutase